MGGRHRMSNGVKRTKPKKKESLQYPGCDSNCAIPAGRHFILFYFGASDYDE